MVKYPHSTKRPITAVIVDDQRPRTYQLEMSNGKTTHRNGKVIRRHEDNGHTYKQMIMVMWSEMRCRMVVIKRQKEVKYQLYNQRKNCYQKEKKKKRKWALNFSSNSNIKVLLFI